MSISVKCGQCSRQLKVPDSMAGKKFACPKCRATVRVEGSYAPVSVPDNKEDENDGRSYREKMRAKARNMSQRIQPTALKPLSTIEVKDKSGTKKSIRRPKNKDDKSRITATITAMEREERLQSENRQNKLKVTALVCSFVAIVIILVVFIRDNKGVPEIPTELAEKWTLLNEDCKQSWRKFDTADKTYNIASKGKDKKNWHTTVNTAKDDLTVFYRDLSENKKYKGNKTYDSYFRYANGTLFLINSKIKSGYAIPSIKRNKAPRDIVAEAKIDNENRKLEEEEKNAEINDIALKEKLAGAGSPEEKAEIRKNWKPITEGASNEVDPASLEMAAITEKQRREKAAAVKPRVRTTVERPRGQQNGRGGTNFALGDIMKQLAEKKRKKKEAEERKKD